MFFAFVIWTISVSINNSKYAYFKVGGGNMAIPKRVYDLCTKNEDEDYLMLKADDYFVLGIGPDCWDIDDSIIEEYGINNTIIKRIGSVESTGDLMLLFNVSQENLIDSGKTNKPSYDAYFIQYKNQGQEVVVLLYKKQDRRMAEIVIAPEGDLSRKEIIDIHKVLRF